MERLKQPFFIVELQNLSVCGRSRSLFLLANSLVIAPSSGLNGYFIRITKHTHKVSNLSFLFSILQCTFVLIFSYNRMYGTGVTPDRFVSASTFDFSVICGAVVYFLLSFSSLMIFSSERACSRFLEYLRCSCRKLAKLRANRGLLMDGSKVHSLISCITARLILSLRSSSLTL